MEGECALCDNCRKHCPSSHVFSTRIFGLRGCQCTRRECQQFGVMVTGLYETKMPVKIAYGALRTDEVIQAIANADAGFKEAIKAVEKTRIKVKFIDTDGTECEFYGLDCVPIRCGETLKLRITA